MYSSAGVPARRPRDPGVRWAPAARARGVRFQESTERFERALRTLCGLAIMSRRSKPSSPPRPGVWGPRRDVDGMGDGGTEPPAGEDIGTVLGRSRRYDKAWEIAYQTQALDPEVASLTRYQMSWRSLVGAVIFISLCGVEMMMLYWCRPGGIGFGSRTDLTESI